MYRDRLENAFRTAKPSGYVGTYPIRSLTGQIKYYLIFATAHEKGFILASDVVYGVEEDYQRELQEFRELQEREKTQATQLSLFEDPTPE
ncbi:MAG TPA: hypothetical protein VEP90_13870, partial [Methylomirabilota bacterium]|nr:hypothetical protein [Methylomirabilota bacterium]